MFISVLIANYNNEKYLDECLSSIVNQTISNSKYEVLVLDDFSTDKSIEIIKKYNVNLIQNKQNIGLSRARGELIKHASKNAKYIFFLDSDDFVSSNCLEELLKTKKQFPEFIPITKTLKNGKIKSTCVEGKLSIINTTQHSKLWDADTLRKIKWPNRIKNEDDYALPLALGNKEFKLSEGIYYHRVVPGSLSTIKNKKNAIRIVDLALKNWPINNRNMSLLHHSVSMEGAGRYFKKECKRRKIKRPSFYQKTKYIGFKRTFADFWTDILF